MRLDLEAQHEFYVDRKITEESGKIKKSDYGQLLLSVVTQNKQALLVNTFYNSLTKERILMMTKMKNHKSYLKNYLSAFLIAFALLFVWSCNMDSSTDHDTSKLNQSYEEMEVLDIVETMPEFIGGDEAMLKFIYSAIQYPAASRENGIEGMAVVQFVVEPDGSISNIEMLRELDAPTTEEILRITKTMPNWKPGKKDGENVRVRFKLPVKFKLE